MNLFIFVFFLYLKKYLYQFLLLTWLLYKYYWIEIIYSNLRIKRIYSEVVIDGFEPIGIFCFTDGSKKLNLNYQYAEELQKSFPQLKIYSFDIMKRKKDEELVEMKFSLLNNLQKKFTNYNYIINKDILPMFDYFFKEYEKLKQKNQYTEEEIDSVIHKAEEFVNQFDPLNKFYIEELNTELEKLTNKIMQTQNDLNTIQEEKRQLQ